MSGALREEEALGRLQDQRGRREVPCSRAIRSPTGVEGSGVGMGWAAGPQGHLQVWGGGKGE